MSFSDLFDFLKEDKSKKRNETAQKVLDYAKTAGRFTLPELQQKLGLDYYGAKRAADELIKEEAVKFSGGLVYECLATEQQEPPVQEEKSEEKHQTFEEYRRAMEARRRALMRRMRMSSDDDDDDEDGDDNRDTDSNSDSDTDSDDDNDDNDDDDESFDDFCVDDFDFETEDDSKLDEVIGFLPKSGEISAINGNRYWKQDDLRLEGLETKFKLLEEDGNIYITDDSLAINALKFRLPLETEGIAKKIDDINARYHVQRRGDELCILVVQPEKASASLVQLFATMDRVASIDLDEHIAFSREERRKREVRNLAGELLQEKPDAGLAELLEELEKRYRALKRQPLAKCRGSMSTTLAALETFQALSINEFLENRAYWCGDEDAPPPTETSEFGMADVPDDPAYLRALAMVVKTREVSLSIIQRRCGVGYAHAGKILEWMELKGYITPFDGSSGSREVLLTPFLYEKLYGPLD